MAFYRVDPWGDQRADLRIAKLVQLIAAAFGDKQPVEKFMLYPEQTAPPISTREKHLAQQAAFRAIATTVIEAKPSG